MKDVLDYQLQGYLNELLPQKDKISEEITEYAQEHHIPIVEDTVANFLQMMVKITNSKNVLEVGTAIGYSTIAIAKALPQEGHITTIELMEERRNKALEFIEKADLNHKITSVLGDAREILKDFQGPYDLIFLDAAKGQYPIFFEHLDKVLAQNGIIIADNVLLNGWVVTMEYPDRRKKTFVHRMRHFLDSFKENPDYQLSLIPLGDGVAIFRKKEKGHE